MFDEPSENPSEDAINPADRAKDKCDEFRMHAELVAVFEGCRKFDAEIRPKLKAENAREIQKTMAKLEKGKMQDVPVIKPELSEQASGILRFSETHKLSTNDYHIHRRPGEVMIVRWLAGNEVDRFYERLQAHFDAAMNQYRQEERSNQEWKQDPKTLAYLEALDKLEVNMPERYLREMIRQHRFFVLSTQTADEMDIVHLCDYVMGAEAKDVVGAASAPPEDPTEADRAWFFKLFSLRGIVHDVERMCFFAFLQKSEESW